MSRTVSLLSVWFLLAAICSPAASQEILDPGEAAKDPDFVAQGEYVGEGAWPDGKKAKLGAQVIARGDGAFDAVVFHGGLPGAGWQRGDRQWKLSGRRSEDRVELAGAGLAARIARGTLALLDTDGSTAAELKRTERKSPTLSEKPPEGAIVLFDGTGVDCFPGATLTDMKTLEAGTTAKGQFDIERLHLEFRLSYKPKARGQGRSNSGVYLGGCPEIQVLDSFGLEGAKNECGALYGRRQPDVNACLPPLKWQTFDVEFTPPKLGEDGRVESAATMTVRHNGIVIHDGYELSRRDGGTRSLHLQKHGNRVQYRNIWYTQPAP